MNLSNPWSLQIALLPVRRTYPDDAVNERAAKKRADARCVAAQRAGADKKSAAARAKIIGVLAGAGADGITAQDIMYAISGGAKRRCDGNLQRHLNELAAAGRVRKIRVNGNVVKWSNAEVNGADRRPLDCRVGRNF